MLARLILKNFKNLTFKYELVEALLYGHGEEPQLCLPHQAQVPYCHGREHPHRNLNTFKLFTKKVQRIRTVLLSPKIALKGPKHDQIECGFFYINPTSMG